MPTPERSAGELKFINEMSRSLLVGWADECARTGNLQYGWTDLEVQADLYKAHALYKGWVTKSQPRRLTSTGWDLAASFLKR